LHDVITTGADCSAEDARKPGNCELVEINMSIKSTTLLRNLRTFLATVGIATLTQTALAQSPSSPPDGLLSLPRPDFRFKGEVGRTYLDSDPATFPQILRPPKGAPNIVLILLDDVGFGQFSAFGGGVSSPNMEKLAARGLRYNRFHTTALCSPTRAALLTGRNHHMSGNGSITEAATGYDGYTGIIPKSTGTVAEILRQNGYATAWVGKNHNTPIWETSEIGPFDRWANGLGFDYFYGFNAGDTSQYEPILYENRNRVPRSTDPGTTCPLTLPTTRSPGCKKKKPSTQIGHSSFMSRQPPPTRRTRRRKNGSTSSKASSTWAGTATVR
jgi:hypothetical protein